MVGTWSRPSLVMEALWTQMIDVFNARTLQPWAGQTFVAAAASELVNRIVAA